MTGKRSRSPNFPAFGLKEAIAKVEKLYEKEGKSRTDPTTAVKAWDFGSLNGASLRVLGALRQYGLVEDVQDDLKVSDAAITIIHGEELDRLSALRAAAKQPRIFSELLQEYGADLPSDESLKARLLTKMNFGSPEAAQQCIQAFRETIEVAKLLDNDYINAEKEAERKAKEKGGQLLDFVLSESFRHSEDPKKDPQMNLQPGKEHFVKVWSLTGGVIAKLEINDIPSKDDQEFLKTCLERALKELENKSHPQELK